nr:ATP-binding protein [Tahibacter caeni]
MISDVLLEDLRYRGEGTDLDFKADRYPFANASDDEKSELLKDILALANASREGTAYILIGFKEKPPYPAEVVGLPAEGAIDDSRIQQFVNAKLESNLNFRYEERMFDGKHVAVIAIPKQRRPFYLKKDFGPLKSNVVYVRRGSSTDVASPREIAMMGASNETRGEAQIRLLLKTENNEVLPDYFARDFLVFSNKLPDYEIDSGPYGSAFHRPNRNYYRESAEYYTALKRAITVRVLMENHSEFALASVQIEIACRGTEDCVALMLRADDMPRKAQSTWDIGQLTMNLPSQAANRRVVVDDRGDEQLVCIDLGCLRPGQIARAEEDLVLIPSAPGSYTIAVRILANELPTPLIQEHAFQVDGVIERLSLKSLKSMIYSDPDLD